jgi:RNA polymerase sigma-70 factor (ECF subfamily)
VSAVAAGRPSPPADAALLADVAAGDLTSLGQLFDRHAEDVRRFIGRLGAHPDEIDDLTQATFLVVLDAAAGFRGEGAARPWLLGLAANVVRRHRRSMARLAARLAAWALEPRDESVATPGESLEQSENAARAARALARLSAKKRDAFVMVAMEGVAPEVAARALGVPVGTVWTRLHHARRELRACLGEEPE